MGVTLRITSGAAAGRRIALAAGQAAQFGRTEWADFSFPDDPAMSDVHFAVESGPQGWRLRDLTGRGATQLNGQAVVEGVLRSGDQIRAGETVFAITVEGQPSAVPVVEGDRNGPTADDRPASDGSAIALCRSFELEEAAQSLLEPSLTPEEFVRRLIERRLLRDAVRVYAHWLPKQQAVRWGCQCIGRLLPADAPETHRAALEAAERWAADPNEENRRQAEAAAEASGMRAPAAWLAVAAFWSGGSLAPAGLPDVPPADHLTGTAVSAALLTVAASQAPAQVATVLESFLSCVPAV